MGEVKGESNAAAEALIPQFIFETLLNQDQGSRRIILLGTVNSKPAILIAERAAFSTDPSHLSSFVSSLSRITNLGANDIYSWFLASSAPSSPSFPNGVPTINYCAKGEVSHSSPPQPPDLKLNLIYPCTPQHIKKYSQQGYRIVTEAPEIYRSHILPYIRSFQSSGRLNWVYNILDGLNEQDHVIYRSPSSPSSDSSATSSLSSSDGNEAFLVLPDLNWDRRTQTSLHLLVLPLRRDLLSVRDLRKRHIPWLKHMHHKLLSITTSLYPSIEPDQLKLYLHYQPTYYHLHIHIVHASLEAGSTQAVGKALGLENITGQLEGMAGDEERGMADVSLTYVVGEASELWTEVWAPLKERKAAAEKGEGVT